MMPPLKLLPLLLQAFLLFAVTMSSDREVPFVDGDPNFLFLGNSYTSANDLPILVANLLEAGVVEWSSRVTILRRDPGGERLVGHLKEANGTKGNTKLRQWLITNPVSFKWITLQEQSQIPGFADVTIGPAAGEYVQSSQAAQALNEIATENGAQTLFILTWGRLMGDSRNPHLYPDFQTMQKHLTEGYLHYVQRTSTPKRPTYVAPVGLVFETIYNDILHEGHDPTERSSLFSRLYWKDGSHPSLAGSYLAALTIYTTITGKDPKEATWTPDDLEENTVSQIQDAVSRTIVKTFDSQTIKYPWQTPWLLVDYESEGEL
jgi:hypothetical protein